MALMLAMPARAEDITFDVDITAKRLDAARQQIQPSLGATRTEFGPDGLAGIPQGADAPLSQVLLRAPGVVQDSFGQLHVRGEHANLQFRINGVALPEGLSVFGQALQSRFADSIALTTGALPAQYGMQTAGVIDITAKSGLSHPGGLVSMTAGSWGWLQPSLEYGGRSGKLDWFVTGDFLRNDRGIENPTNRFNAIHDRTEQWHGVASLTATIDPETRLGLLFGGFSGRFQIPNNPGQPTLGFPVNGVSDFDSSRLRETQHERTEFAVLSLQKHIGDVDLVLAAYVRDSWLHFTPDPLGDLLFTGIAQTATRSTTAAGIQGDASWRVNDAHTIRFGVFGQFANAGAHTLSQVLPADADGIPTSTSPINIADGYRKSGGRGGVYVQDAWALTPTVTLNAGLRFDAVSEITRESQLSPRLNIVWQATPSTTLHAGYSRYFVPPSFETVSAGSIARLLGTTAAPAVTTNSPARAERSHYFDVGISQIVLPGLTLGVDAYYKISRNLLDEGQFGAPIILSSFNYADGRQQGVEFSASYQRGPWSLYGNAAWSRALGRRIVSAQFNFGQDELDYISGHFIHLDHDQTWTGSAGAAYVWDRDGARPTRFSADVIVQSGLRATVGAVPNGVALPTYAVVNFSLTHQLAAATQVRLDILNVGDARYQIRNGSGVGVGAPQYGLRRTILAGVSQRF